MAGERKGTSPWIYIGCGCLALVGLVILAFGGLAFWGMKTAQSYVETMSDPAAREARTRELLGTDQLPEGYYAHMFLSVPWMMDMVVLGDQPVTSDGEGDIDLDDLAEKAFFYFAIRDFGQEHVKLRRYITGETDHLDLDLDFDFDFDPEETLARGSFDLDEQHLVYVVERGELDTHRGHHDGINTTMMIDCPTSERLRLGMWFQRSPEQDGVVEDPGAAAPVVSEDDIRQFMSHFRLCTD